MSPIRKIFKFRIFGLNKKNFFNNQTGDKIFEINYLVINYLNKGQ